MGGEAGRQNPNETFFAAFFATFLAIFSFQRDDDGTISPPRPGRRRRRHQCAVCTRRDPRRAARSLRPTAYP
ncbi:hypothetical protein CHELA40_11273 [Chelatococcus asaccharovorans]|nr:hypothetical protein CHELA40_11273 [Chelatococcus asaccharovorans]CAH1685097.1 hypothetical protein CHELA17_64329 [Chelatococcus asaccharovorans]